MNHRVAVVVRHWLVWVLLLVTLTVVSFIDAFGPLYWVVLALYAGQVLFNAATRPAPPWRRTDSRKTDGDERG